MNFLVNLIEEEEIRRGGSHMALFVLRALGVTVPVAILLFVAHTLVVLRLSSSELVRLEELIEAKKPNLAMSADVMAQKRYFLSMQSHLEGWETMRTDGHRTLAAWRSAVPLEVQLTSLAFSQAATSSNTLLAATAVIRTRGKIKGPEPESHLTRFRLNLVNASGFQDAMEAVDVPEGAFVEDTSPGAQPTDRIFELNARFQPRPFK